MNYEKFRTITSQEEYFNSWDSEQLEQLNEEHKKEIYDKYVIKCIVFQEANFKCEHEECKTPDSPLTLHHIKFQKNGGKTSVKNGACVCKACHKSFHRGKKPLIIRGATYQLHVEESVNWKQIKFEGKQIRKNHKNEHGYKVSWEIIRQLMKFLNINYNECYEDNVEGEDD